jgi:hypothetical protein
MSDFWAERFETTVLSSLFVLFNGSYQVMRGYLRIQAGLVFLTLFFSHQAVAEPISALQRTSKFSLQSRVLDEAREIYVLAPEKFDPNCECYTTVYVLDGEWSFLLVSSYLAYLSRWNRIPDIVVTGVRNVNRNRDYLFAEDRNFPASGGAESFTKFVKEEWMPTVEKAYGGNGKRVLLGHSFGGTYTLYSLISDPGLFDAYIAIGSSTWVSGKALFPMADEYLKTPNGKNLFLYMAVAEADGGATVPDGIAFARKFEENPLPSLEVHFEIIKETNHFTAVTPGMISAFEKLYPVWGMDKEVREIALRTGSKGLDEWFEKKQADLGYRFQPPKMELEFLAIELAREGYGEAAETVVNSLLKRNPKSYSGHFALGFVYYHQEKYAEAVEPFEKAASFAREAGETSTLIARYDRAAENVRTRLEAE